MHDCSFVVARAVSIYTLLEFPRGHPREHYGGGGGHGRVHGGRRLPRGESAHFPGAVGAAAGWHPIYAERGRSGASHLGHAVHRLRGAAGGEGARRAAPVSVHERRGRAPSADGASRARAGPDRGHAPARRGLVRARGGREGRRSAAHTDFCRPGRAVSGGVLAAVVENY